MTTTKKAYLTPAKLTNGDRTAKFFSQGKNTKNIPRQKMGSAKPEQKKNTAYKTFFSSHRMVVL
jgi:hypothetical protein